MGPVALDEQGISRAHIEVRRERHEPLTFDGFTVELAQGGSDLHASTIDRRLALLVLGSGSKGNASIVCDHRSGEGILIDAGICKRDVFSFARQGGFDLANLKAILISHSHSDHVKNIGVISRGLASLGIEVPLFAHEQTIASSKVLSEMAEVMEVHPLAAHVPIELGGFHILPLATSHDTEVSFGFRIDAGRDALGFVTDTGVLLPETRDALKGVRILGLESNHDPKMLKDGPYPRSLKERVASDRGHLSNEQASKALEELASDALEVVVALHISENNNTYRLPVETLRKAARDMGQNIAITCAYQRRPVFIGIEDQPAS